MCKSRYQTQRYSIALIVGPVIASSLAGCTVRRAPTILLVDAVKLSTARQAAYERTETQFDHAEFWKPRDSTGADIAALAPLIVQQTIDDSNRDQCRPQFGALIATSSGSARVDTHHPTVYFRTGTAKLGGAIRKQIEYIWFYAPQSVSDGPNALDSLLIRATLGEDGFPLVWELDDSGWLEDGDPRLLFVADSLEALAMDTFDQASTDRRYFIERSVVDAPRTVVAKLIEDGPIPMGPYVYLSARPRRVVNMLCRCSPSQVHAIDENGYYDLKPLGEIEDVLDRLPSGLARRLTASGRDIEDNRDLEKALRWPKGKL